MSFGAVKRIITANELNLLLEKCINNNFTDFPSDDDKYKKAVDFIFTYIHFNFTSKFLEKNNYKEEIMIRNNKIYKIEPDKLIKYLYKFYCLIRIVFKKLKIYL